MSFTENPARRAFLKAAAGSIVAATQAQSVLAQSINPYSFSSSVPALPVSLSVSVVGDMAPSLSKPIHNRLVLCMDASSSMISSGCPNFAIQVEGTATALESEAVSSVIKYHGGIAVTCVQFANAALQSVPWAFIADEKDARRYANLIRAAGQKTSGSTEIVNGLAVSGLMFEGSPYKAVNSVVDISSDGTNDSGTAILKETTRLLASNHLARVNGLAICDKEPAMDQYMKAHVVTDENMFNEYGAPLGRVWKVANMRDYTQVMMQKLVDEVAALSPGQVSPGPYSVRSYG